mgnify:CR=1
MKKIMLVSLVAVMMMSFTACMKKEEVKDEITFKSYIEDTVPDETTEETTTPEETEVVTEETTVSEETESAGENVSSTILKANGCTIKINSSEWLDVMNYIEAMKATSGETDEMNALAEKVKSTCDGAYYHINLSGANFTVVSAEVGEQASQMDLSDNIIAGMLANALETELTKSGMAFVGAEMEKFNGNPSLVITTDSPAIITGTVDMRAQMCIFYEGTHQYMITFTAEKENFDKYKSDFYEVMNSITFN